MINERQRPSVLRKETFWLEGDWLGEDSLCYFALTVAVINKAKGATE